MDKGKWGYLGCISGWFGALGEALRVTDGELRVCQRDRDILDAILLRKELILHTFGMDKGECGYVHFWFKY